ncbi:hypothetical protein Glove_481g24 [Diversispora epigaea]|uniref:Uncharacterized protein n=1 Tax=Diversispora epigaea TaxID=1348612 RepID=A0A397GL55_9GLOM|nr:hypothetical protein Glove_481g24 [Diversispora epigaea]
MSIRYFHISDIDIWKKIKPYREILRIQLWDDLNQHLIILNQPVKSLVLPARIIPTSELPPRVISTIYYLFFLENIQYKFQLIQLILRGTWDNTKIENTDMETNDNFVFSLKNELINDKKEYIVAIEVDKGDLLLHTLVRYNGIIQTIYELVIVTNKLKPEELSEKLESYLVEFKAS